MKTQFYRVEIIANHSVEDDLMAHMKEHNCGSHYTLIPTVDGAGNSGSRMGDGVWPEENFVLILYADEAECGQIKAAVLEVKNLFPSEGIKMFRTSAEVLV